MLLVITRDENRGTAEAYSDSIRRNTMKWADPHTLRLSLSPLRGRDILFQLLLFQPGWTEIQAAAQYQAEHKDEINHRSRVANDLGNFYISSHPQVFFFFFKIISRDSGGKWILGFFFFLNEWPLHFPFLTSLEVSLKLTLHDFCVLWVCFFFFSSWISLFFHFDWINEICSSLPSPDADVRCAEAPAAHQSHVWFFSKTCTEFDQS